MLYTLKKTGLKKRSFALALLTVITALLPLFTVAAEYVDIDPALAVPLEEDRLFIAQTYLNSGGSVTFEYEGLRGVWVASVYNIDFPVKGSTVANQKLRAEKILDTAKEAGLNTVFLQVRPTCDAFYGSSVFPWSDVLTGTQGQDPGYDPLQYFIDEGAKRGIEIHAWINPYRVTTGTASAPQHDVNALAKNHPVRKDPSLTIKHKDGKMYLDPGNPAVTELIVEGVREIAEKYDVAGIHFDDYFYPEGDFDDSASYKKYGNGLPLADWRRQNTYNMVKAAHDAVKAANPNISFGVSPSGIWRNQKSSTLGSDTNGYESYSQGYADTRKWVKDAIIDYIAPQLYWTIGQSGSDYEILLKWWSDVCEGTGVDLYIGHAAYKVGTTSPSGWLDKNQIPRQIEMSGESEAVSGNIFYGYSKIEENTLDLKTTLAAVFSGEAVEVLGDTGEIKQLVISYPSSGHSTTYSNVYIIGTGDSRIPIYVDGKEIERTASGHFALYMPLKSGTNTFKFSYNGEVRDFVVKKSGSNGSGSTSTPYVMTSPSLRPSSGTPTSTKLYSVGEQITLSVTGISGAKVNAIVGGTTVQLTEDTSSRSKSGDYTTAKYTSKHTLQRPLAVGKTDLGKVTYKLDYNGKTDSITSAGSVQIYVPDSRITAVLKTDATIMRVSNSSEADRLTALPAGITDYVEYETPTYVKLRYGGFTLSENVEFITQTLADNRIRGITGQRTADSTVIEFSMPVPVPYTIKTASDRFEITFYNTVGRDPFKISKQNPLFTDFTYSQSDYHSVYTLWLKEADGFYGYGVEVKGEKVIFTFKNPLKKADGGKPLTGKTIVVDAGHGGSDRGAMGPEGTAGRNEKDLNMTASRILERVLTEAGATVVMTRTDDTSVKLVDRAARIRACGADLSISIHHNSLSSNYDIRNYYGMLTLYSEDFSKPFAKSVHDAVVSSTGKKDVNVRWQALAVCRIYECPSILLELGYISNPYDFETLSNTAVMEQTAKGVLQGIINYLK